MDKKQKRSITYGAEILFSFWIYFCSQGLNLGNTHSFSLIARYVVYLVLAKGLGGAFHLLFNKIQSNEEVSWQKLVNICKLYVLVLAGAAALLCYQHQKILSEDFPLLFMAHLVMKYPEMEKSNTTINYGTGMACSFFEGYLVHVIPNDGGKFVGFEENICIYESKHSVVFPVRKLLLVITKSLYCPPDLSEFNKKTRDVSFVEACSSLEDVKKDVAGVKNRVYRNSAYKIHRAGGAPHVYVTAECASPLHTLHRVLQKKALYEELADTDATDIVNDFCSTLRKIIANSPECRDKCELVYFDDTDKTQNLADVLLDKIRELEPNFESIIEKGKC